MKILHTSDWHLGKKLEHYNRISEQVEVLDEIVELANKEMVDVVVIAGDLFDTFNPPVEAIELFYTTLKKLTRNCTCPVIAIAGNHDSPDRIEAPDPLAKINGIIFSGYPETEISKIELEGCFAITRTDKGFIELKLKNGEFLRLILTPFASEQRLFKFFDKEKEETISGFMQAHWKELADKYCDKNGVNMILAHLLMYGRDQNQIEETDDEKSIELISEKMSSSIVPSVVDYVALGHLHRFQNVSENKNCPVVYSGSPLAYSFSEANQTKKVVIIEKQSGEQLQLRTIDLLKGKRLIRKKFSSLAEASKWLSENSQCLVECTIKGDEYFKPSDIKQLHDIHEGIISIIPEISNINSDTTIKKEVDLSKNINLLFEEYFQYKNGIPANEEIKLLFKEVINEQHD